VFYYSVEIFQKSGLSLENSQLATIAAGCCNLFMAILSIPVMAKFNRRTTLQLSLTTTTFFLVLLGIAIILTVRFFPFQFPFNFLFVTVSSVVDVLLKYRRRVGFRNLLRNRSGSHSVFYRIRVVRSRSSAQRYGFGKYGQLGREFRCGVVFPNHVDLFRGGFLLYFCSCRSRAIFLRKVIKLDRF
jgi:hypothetical protein